MRTAAVLVAVAVLVAGSARASGVPTSVSPSSTVGGETTEPTASSAPSSTAAAPASTDVTTSSTSSTSTTTTSIPDTRCELGPESSTATTVQPVDSGPVSTSTVLAVETDGAATTTLPELESPPSSITPTPPSSASGEVDECLVAPRLLWVRPGPSAALVRWVPGESGATPEKYEVRAVDRVTLAAVEISVQGPTTDAVFDDLLNGVEYEVRVRALSGRIESEWSAPLRVVPSLGEEPSVQRLIVKYASGVPTVESGGRATGSDDLGTVALEPGRGIGAGMRTVELSESVSEDTALVLAERLAEDSRVEWAEPDRVATIATDNGHDPFRGSRPEVAGTDVVRTAQSVPSKSGAPTPRQSVSRGTVGISTACTASSSVEPIARCYDDADYDADLSLDAEIIWSDAYVRGSSPSTLLVDSVPYSVISDGSWLSYSDTYLWFVFDVDGDDLVDVVVSPNNATLGQNGATSVTIYDWSGSWVSRTGTCSGTVTRRYGDHAAINLTTNSWWQLSVAWSCLFGAATTNVRFSVYMEDYLTDGDFSPDSFSDLAAMNFGSALPSAPRSLIGTSGNGSGSVAFTAPFNRGSSAISNYQYSLNNGISWLTRSPASIASPLTLSGLTNGTTYSVRLRAVNASGAGAASDAVTITPGTVPGAPTITGATPMNGAASVSFTAPLSNGGVAITNYQYSTNGGSSWVTRWPTSTSSPLQIGSLTNGTSYSIRLRAVNGVGFGAQSATVSVTPLGGGSTVPDDPFFEDGSMWGLDGIYGINAPGAWSITLGEPSVVVAVIDTGSTEHPDLAGQEVAGYDFVDDVGSANDGDGWDSDPADPGDACGGDDSSWHGTHVAGTIAAISDNAIGVVGVAPRVKVQHVRVLGECGGSFSDIVAGITWTSGGSVPGAPSNPTPARVINMSLGGSSECTEALQTAIDGAVARGTTVVVAAGNENDYAANHTPANCAGVITVAATASNGLRAWFSNFGAAVDIAAPGVDIWSTLNSGLTTPTSPTYASYNGTSMATPHVAGVVALMRSQNPSMTPAQVESKIKTSGNTTPFPGGACSATAYKTCGAGIINASALLVSGVATPSAPTVVSATPGNRSASVVFDPPTRAGGSPISNYQYSLDGGTSWVTRSPASTVSPLTIAGLVNGTTYVVRLRALNAAGVGTASDTLSVTPRDVPTAPLAVSVTPDDQELTVRFSPPASNGGSPITNYQYSLDGGTSWVTRSPASTVSPLTIAGLVNGSAYQVRLRALNDAGTGAPSGTLVATPRTVPGDPVLGVVTAGDRSVSVSFSPPASNGGSPITNYQYSLNGGTSWVTRSPASTNSPLVLTGLVNGASYRIRLRAMNAAGAGVASDSITAVPSRS